MARHRTLSPTDRYYLSFFNVFNAPLLRPDLFLADAHTQQALNGLLFIAFHLSSLYGDKLVIYLLIPRGDICAAVATCIVRTRMEGFHREAKRLA